MRRPARGLATALLAAAAISTQARSADAPVPASPPAAKFELTVDSIMRGPALVGWPPTGLRWAPDSSTLYFEWRKPGEDEASTYAVPRGGGEPRKLSEEEARNVPPPAGRWDRARRRVLYTERGDVVMFDAAIGRRLYVTRTTAAESNPRWARNDTHVTFVREGNLFIVGAGVPGQAAGDAVVAQLTDVAARRPEPRPTESQKFLSEEEARLIDYIREQKEEKLKAEEKAKRDKLPAFELHERQTATDLALSPDGTHVFLLVAERPAGAKPTIVPNYVTESGYTQDVSARGTVGDAQDRRLLATLNLKTGKSVWADGSFAPPVAEAEQPVSPEATTPDKRPERKAEREIRWSMPVVSDDGKHVVASARSADNKDRWFVALDPESGTTRVIDTLHDDAWIREASFGGGTLQFLPDNRRVAFLSERDGWMHLYTLDVSEEGATPKQLTSGRWEVTAADLSPDRKRFYVTTNEAHPGERHVYSVSIDGGGRTKITAMPGSHDAEVSPDDSTLGLVYSYSTKPPEVYVMPNRPGAAARQVTTTPTDEWRSFAWIDPKVVTFKARDGVDVYARLFTPEMAGVRLDQRQGTRLPAVVFVHGAGYLQNAHRYWSSYFREYMFHNLLASRGYVVLDVDYRASAGYGREWRTAIYRHMGARLSSRAPPRGSRADRDASRRRGSGR